MTTPKLKIMTVVGTRPEIIRLSRTLAKLDQTTDHILVHTGQNYDYELNQIFFDDLGLRKPDYFLDAAGSTGSETIGRVIIAIDALLAQVKPEALLVLGDTNSCLSVIPAKRRKIPTFHMEAGNRCFDLRVPEETNRRIVDHTADVNLPYSTIARNYLLSEGFSPDLVIKTGSPMFEVLQHYRSKIETSNIMNELGLETDQFFLVSAHREENIEPDPSFKRLVELLNGLAEDRGYPIIVSTHPRTRKRIESSAAHFHSLVHFIKPISFSDYNRLQCEAFVTLSDSGTISEESSILNFRSLNIREAHERPEAMEEAAVMMVGLNLVRVLQSISILETQPKNADRVLRLVEDYSVPNVSEKVVRIIHSYVDYVRRVVWQDNV
jgi:UDP-N-acetylglucosamine 2-epimerase (non-hydrolysing)